MDRVPYKVESAELAKKYREDKAKLKKAYPNPHMFKEKAAELLEQYRIDKKNLEKSWHHRRRPDKTLADYGF